MVSARVKRNKRKHQRTQGKGRGNNARNRAKKGKKE